MKKDFYDPAGLLVENKRAFRGARDFLKDKDDAYFHIGQSYEEKPAQQAVCLYCGGGSFEIAFGSYYTAARCVNCKWEVCIHEG